MLLGDAGDENFCVINDSKYLKITRKDIAYSCVIQHACLAKEMGKKCILSWISSIKFTCAAEDIDYQACQPRSARLQAASLHVSLGSAAPALYT